jgi:RHS repeat-associated protein
MRDAASLDQRDGDDNPVWTRLERDWMADAALAPGFEPSQVTAVRLRHTPSGDPMLGGAISFSNSITIEENTLGPGVVGHLLHARTISPVTFAAVDRWFAYHQVGSVLAETDADGELAATHHADAWGNRLEDWDTGVWGGVRVGWAHNTKEIDGLTDLTYMYKRWYAPETGTFLSRAPYEPMIEHEYGFAAGNPVSLVDPDGRIITYGGDESERRILENSVDTLERTDPRFKMFIDNLKQSEAETHIMPTDGRSGASDQGPLRNVIWINIMDRCENRPLIVTLGHELVHAHDYILGIINRNVSPNSPPDRPWTVAEDRATAWENLLRTRLGLPTRANYGDNGLGNQVGAGAARPVPRIQ